MYCSKTGLTAHRNIFCTFNTSITLVIKIQIWTFIEQNFSSIITHLSKLLKENNDRQVLRNFTSIAIFELEVCTCKSKSRSKKPNFFYKCTAVKN